MTELDDHDLLAVYVRDASEPAFATLVARYVNLVYSAALRFTGNPHHSEEITQAVFIILARKAGGLRRSVVLSGWLYQTARLTAANFVKGEIRRQNREQEAYMQSTLNEPETAAWRQIAPALDEAMGSLGEADRNAVVLRFFENKTAQEVAAQLNINEGAAHKRLARALEKMRQFFRQRGVVLTATTLAGAVSANSVHAAPAGLANTISTVALAKGAAATGSTLTLVKGALKVMAWSKAKAAAFVGLGVLLAAGTTTVTLQMLPARDGAVRAQVLEIVRNTGDNYWTGADQMAKLGPAALPILEELVRWKKSWWDYSDATRREKLHYTAVGIVANLGPAGVRPLTSALCQFVNSPKPHAATPDDGSNTLLPACNALLHCSVPDSPLAVATLTNWLANPARSECFGGWDDFVRLPDAVTWLIPWLKNKPAYVTAHTLGIIGTNAVAAIPALIEVSLHGIDPTPPELKVTNYYSYYPTGGKQLVQYARVEVPSLSSEERARNRSYALAALGQIGVASPEVVATLQDALSDTNALVRFGALKALYVLHQPPDEPLDQVLDSFAPRQAWPFMDIIQWAGHLGPDGRAALPWLRRLTNLTYLQTLPKGRDTGAGWDPLAPAQELQAAAILAIGEIDPGQIDPQTTDGRQLMHQFEGNWEATQQVRCESNNAPILTLLKPFLASTNTGDAALAAYIVLGNNPADPAALQTLRHCASAGGMSDRLTATEWLKEQTGDASGLLELCIAGLKSPESAQSAAIYLGQLGDDARPAIPALKAALWANDTFAREAAGRALQKIAPAELPAIH